MPPGDAEKAHSATSTGQWARERGITFLFSADDWQAMFRNSARNLEKRHTELVNAILVSRF